MLSRLAQTNFDWKGSAIRWKFGIAAFLAATVLLLSNLVFANETKATAPQNLSTPVRLMTLTLEDQIAIERRLLGRIEAQQSAELGFGFAGTIKNLPVTEGQRVRRGDVLAKIADETYVVQLETLRNNLAAAQSQLGIAQAAAERVKRLVDRKAAPSNRLSEAESETQFRASRVIELEGAIKEMELRIAQSQLLAPFDGIVGMRAANQGEMVAAGQTVLSIYQGGRADFRVGIPSSLTPDALLNTRILVNGQQYPVALRAVRPDIDSRTNTRTAIFEVMAPDIANFGLSATLISEVVLPLRGAWVPVDALRPSAEGYWIVLAVGDDMIARRIAVEVLHLRDDEAFVSGVFDTGTQIISLGAHKVVPGQAVRAQ